MDGDRRESTADLLTSLHYSSRCEQNVVSIRQIGSHVGQSPAGILDSMSRSEGRVRPEMVGDGGIMPCGDEYCRLGQPTVVDAGVVVDGDPIVDLVTVEE